MPYIQPKETLDDGLYRYLNSHLPNYWEAFETDLTILEYLQTIYLHLGFHFMNNIRSYYIHNIYILIQC